MQLSRETALDQQVLPVAPKGTPDAALSSYGFPSSAPEGGIAGSASEDPDGRSGTVCPVYLERAPLAFRLAGQTAILTAARAQSAHFPADCERSCSQRAGSPWSSPTVCCDP